MSVETINGSRTSFGPRTTEKKTAYAVHVAGVRKQLVVPVKFDELPTHITGDATGAMIPSNALITGLFVTPATETFVGGTSYAVNLVDDEGNIEATIEAAITLAEMNSGLVATVADTTVGTGGPVYVEVVETGTFTAGEGTMVIEYIDQIV